MRVALVVVMVAFLWQPPACFSQTRYWNDTWNFCVDYPHGWQVIHPFDEYGIEFRHAESIEMSFGTIKAAETLEDNFRTAYLGDTSVTVVGRRSTTFRGRPAIVATLISDRSPKNAQHVMTVAGDSAGVIYEFRITAPDQATLKKYLPTFRSELTSFKFGCK